MKRPSFQFYPSDWLSSQRVSLMSLEEEGAYIRLLCYCWQHGSIPNEPDKIARLLGKGGSTTLALMVQPMFQPNPNGTATLVHDRLEAEKAKQEAWANKSREGGIKSALIRLKLNDPSTTLQPPLQGCLKNGGNQKATLQSSSSTSSSNKEEKDVEPPELKLEEDVQFPPNLDTIPFRLAWQSYMAYRKTGRMKPLQPASIAAQLKKLSEWGHDIAIAAINETIANAWQGIFFPKTGPAGTIVRPVFTRQRAASSL